MKKLIGLLSILLITISVSGQPHVRQAGYIEKQSHWVETKDLPLANNSLPLSNPDRRQQAETIGEVIYDKGFYNKKGEIWIDYAHFISNGRLFMLSYEDYDDRIATNIPEHLNNADDVLEAELFLYSIDLSAPKSDWEIASVEKIAGEYKPSNILVCPSINVRNYTDVDFYMYGGESKTGKVTEYDNGSVEIIVSSYAFENGSRVYSEYLTFVFTPVDDKHYTFVRK